MLPTDAASPSIAPSSPSAPSRSSTLLAAPFAFPSDVEALPWQPIKPGFHRKLLRGGTDRDVRVQLLRLEPGTVIPRHRHAGEVHALNLTGYRKLLDTGEIIGPGGYVYEPPGNIDSWMAVGDAPLIVFTTALGAIDYLDDRDEIIGSTTTSNATSEYEAFVRTRPALPSTGVVDTSGEAR